MNNSKILKVMKNKITEIEQYVIVKVKELRIRENITQAELAHRLGVSVGFIGKIESLNHNAKYNLNHINSLAKIFNCSPSFFLPKKPL